MTQRSAAAPLSVAVAMAVAASPAGAQQWTAHVSANGSLLFGAASDPGGSLSIGCTAPAPENLPLIETGSHESHRTDPFQVYVMFSDQLFEWSDPYRIDGAVLRVGDVGYGLPPIELNELQGTAIYLPMADPLIQALYAAPSLVLDTGQGVAYAYPVDGIEAALQTALSHCVTRWEQLGHQGPGGLAGTTGAAAEPTSTGGAAQYSPAQLLPLPSQPPAAGDAHLRARCGGDFAVDPAHLQYVDLDGDGTGDYVLNYAGLDCFNGQYGGGYCGAANCSIDVFLSSRNYADPEEFLGVALDAVADQTGRVGLLLAATFSICADGFCDTAFFWTGTEFAQ